jgi:hypothetical protein
MIHLACQYFLNHRLEEPELRRQVRELAAAGYESIYGHARQGLKIPYLSEAWWEAIRTIVEECRKAGIKFSIWDEDYFPSGTAGDRIIWNYPELAAQSLDFIIEETPGDGKPVEVLFKNTALLKCYALPREGDGFGAPLDLTAYCGTLRSCWAERRLSESAYSISCKIGTPHWRTSINHKVFALSWQPEDKRSYTIVAVQILRNGGRHNTDLLNPQTTRKFIEYTHQEYLNHFSDDILRKHFHASFMDEPAPGGAYPWTGAFEQEFIADHGFSLLDYLPHLILDIDAATPFVRHCYRMTQMRLQCINYLAEIQNWCAEHGISSVGHLTRTEFLSIVGYTWPNELRCCKYLDIPCTDPLGAGIAWPDACAYHTGLKVVSSAAHIFNKAQAGSDALAVMGNETSLRDLKFSLDFQMAMGINYFNIHGLNYSLDGPRKDETPPSLFYQHTEWKYMDSLLKHTRETCAALSGGKHLCHIAVLYPAASLYCTLKQGMSWKQNPLEEKIHHLSETLLSHQKDFDFVDEITLAELTNSGLPEAWQVIILPYLCYITAGTAECLKKFIEQGGRLIVLGRQPQLLGNSLNNPLSEWTADNIQLYPALTDQLLSELPGPAVEGEGANDIFVLQREKDGKTISFLVNRAEREFSGRFMGKELRIAPKGSVLLPGRLPEQKKLSSVDILADKWTLEFEQNHIPLGYWNVADIDSDIPADVYFPVKKLNLLDRQMESDESPKGRKRYQTRFLFTGSAVPLKLVLEESSLSGDCKVFVNQVEITDFRREQIYDCLNITAEIGHALRCGTTPAENIITIEGEGLSEVPYLYGNFRCEYRHAHRSLPYLTTVEKVQHLNGLQPWNVLGYGTFSGTGTYARQIDISKAGEYQLLLGQVEDIAEVFIDGRSVAVLPWPPYECSLGKLEAGTHELKIEITNGPGNRDRLAYLPAGLLGPVSIGRSQ